MAYIDVLVARANALNPSLPRGVLSDVAAITAAAYPLPVYGADGNPIGRVLGLGVTGDEVHAQVQYFTAQAPTILRPTYAEVDLAIRGTGRMITAAVLDSLSAAAFTPDSTVPGINTFNPDGDASTNPTGDDGEPNDENITVDADLPVAPLDTEWDPHTATARMLANATGNDGLVDTDMLGSGFLYQDPGSDGNSVDDYQFPVADVLGGALTIIPNALLDAAAVIDAGGPPTAHIDDNDMQALADVLDELYSNVAASAQAGMSATDSAEAAGSQAGVEAAGGCESCGGGLTAAATVDLPIAADATTWDGSAAQSRVLKWATNDDGSVNATKLGTAFLWRDPKGDPTTLAGYKLPVADVIGGTLMIVPAAVRAAAASLGGARTALKGLTPAAKKTARNTVDRLMGRVRGARKGPASSGSTSGGSVTAAATSTATVTAATSYRRHLRPPGAYFDPIALPGPTPITVTADGEVYGHVADWETCHRSFVAAGICVPPPHSRCDYCHFKLGTTITAEGNAIKTGAYSVGGGHASTDAGVGMAAATRHYDDVASVPAVGITGEDAHGIYFHGALTPSATDTQIYNMLAFPPSGDWREERPGTGLEMIAVTAVPVPGYPVQAGLTASGAVESLIIPNQRAYVDSAETSTESELTDILAAATALADEAVQVLAASIGRTRTDELTALAALVHR